MHLALLGIARSWATFWAKNGEKIVFATAKIIVILVGYLIIRYLFFRLIDRLNSMPLAKAGDLLGARKARLQALHTVLRSVVGVVLAFFAFVMILAAAGISIIPIITGAGLVGLAVGFGAQKLVRDVISGFFILMEDQYGVGDFVSVGAVSGIVEELGMRTTRIRDSAGKLWILSNGDIAQVGNFSRGPVRMSVDIAIVATSNIEKAREILTSVGDQIANDLTPKVKAPFVVEGVTAVCAASTALRLSGDVSAAAQEEIRLELLGRIRKAFAEAGIGLA